MNNEQSIAEEVLAAEADRCNAIGESDWGRVNELLAEEFTYTHNDGRIDNKEQQMTSMRSKARTIERSNLTVRIYGDTAVMNGRNIFRFGPQTDGSPSEVELEVMQVWVRQSGHWQVVAHQSSKVSSRT